MIDLLIAYPIAELEKLKVLSVSENLHKSKFLSDDQWSRIRTEYVPKFYIPSFFMRLLLFVFSIFGMMTVIGPIRLILGDLDPWGDQILALILGILLLFLTEKILIKKKMHFNSGITEAGIYSGLLFVAFGLLGIETHHLIIYALVGFCLSAFAAIRYLNQLATVSAVGFFGWVLFQFLFAVGGIVETLMPFIFMLTFGFVCWYCQKLQSRFSNVIFDDQFTIVKSISLLLFYLSGNYFVVRELSISIMGLALTDQQDIPYAFIFYLFTAFAPVGFIYWGIIKKSILFIRIGLLILALSVITFKHYFSLGFPVLFITISGALLIIIALVLLNYLKKNRGVFTRELLLHNKWSSSDLMALVASQTLGGNKMSDETNNPAAFNGGSFGGAGAGNNW